MLPDYSDQNRRNFQELRCLETCARDALFRPRFMNSQHGSAEVSGIVPQPLTPVKEKNPARGPVLESIRRRALGEGTRQRGAFLQYHLRQFGSLLGARNFRHFDFYRRLIAKHPTIEKQEAADQDDNDRPNQNTHQSKCSAAVAARRHGSSSI
jgi:hypothetical protein